MKQFSGSKCSTDPPDPAPDNDVITNRTLMGYGTVWTVQYKGLGRLQLIPTTASYTTPLLCHLASLQRHAVVESLRADT